MVDGTVVPAMAGGKFDCEQRNIYFYITKICYLNQNF